MSKLLERLSDPARSGVYRVTRADEVLDALRGSPLALARLDLRQPVFEAFSQALAFPDWFGRNWDALEDCLTDLSWRPDQGQVLLMEGARDGGMLVEVLGAAAQFWAGQGRSFFAVFLDPDRRLDLPDLFREA
ncbi:MAG TPA: barstar family protein [Burkholderiales bacterium]|nr:barstar family protein [Burkholderiales bacterium]